MKRFQGHLEIVLVEAKNLSSRSVINPYCIIELVGPKSTHEFGKSSTIDDHYNPKWLSTITADIDQELVEIRFIVKDKSLFKDDKLGSCVLSADNIGNEFNTIGMELINKKLPNAGQLFVKVKFTGSSEAGAFKNVSKGDKHKGCVPKKMEDGPMPTKFLHGKLIVTVDKADKLPNLDSSLLSRKNKSDPFVVVGVQDECGEVLKLARTETIDDNLSPEWNEKFTIDLCHDVSNVVFVVYDEDVVKHDKMCSTEIPVDTIESGRLYSGEQQLYKHKTKEAGKLTLSVQYIKLPIQSSFAVQNCVYPVRSENKFKLYQDARCETLPVEVRDSRGRARPPQNAWRDIYDTLAGAKKFICITGWSLNASIMLVRAECGSGETIGKILLDRAEDDVDVRILLWDEAESTDAKKDTAKEFFKESLVKVDLIARKKQKKDVFHRDTSYAKCGFSHNQKCIIADQTVEDSPGLRNVVAYVGCFDLTSGRYDTPEHKLSNNGDGDQKNQFYNNLLATITKSSSKTPFHDVICKVVGSAALDVYENFQSRWETEAQCAESDFAMGKSQGLYKEYTYGSLDSWQAQCFRSITEDSARLEASDCIFTYAGTRTDNSLHRAYIHQIQKAQHFIYMETSLFMGSSHFWNGCNDIQIKNLIPIEITTKITQKIKEGQLFVVYILLSLHPEGNPDDMIAQEMLHWQYHTMEMMYNRIGAAIAEKGVDTHPQDYLLFLSLGKREETDATPKLLKQLSDDGPLPSLPNLTKQKRSMITVNSKLGIFDDEYIIVGSGTVNDRAMVGNRNTELALGFHQPRVGAVGEISTFRKCLWAEHLGADAPIDLDPSSVQCARKVRQLSEDSLKCYIDITQPLPKCHMMLYPVSVDKSGDFSVRSDCEKFPDSKASISGARSRVIPDSLTT